MNSQKRKSTVERCIDALEREFSVVVETERLRHLIVDGYNIRMMDRGVGCWSTPQAFTWHQWMGDLWQSIDQTASSGVKELLSGNQTTALWEQVIARSIRSNKQDEFEYLLWHVTSTANQAKSAYQLISKYRIDDSEFDRELSEDSRIFLSWLQDYRSQLKRKGCIDLESLPEEIVCQLSNDQNQDVRKILFAGFDEWPPQNEQFLDSLKQLGWDARISIDNGKETVPDVSHYEFETVNEEIEQCANWARSVIEESPEKHHVGIVVPSLAMLQSNIQRTFSAILNPDAVLDKRQENQLSYHITLGTNLDQTPLIVDAMNLLELIKNQVEVSVMCSVVQSDRLKSWDLESEIRSKFACELFTLRVDTTSIDDTLAIMESRNLKGSELYRTFSTAARRLSQTPQFADFGFWAQFITDWLSLFQANSREGRSFSDAECRAHAQWGNLVEGLAELGYLSSKVRIEDVIAQLRRTTQNSNFQSRALRVPIQIGGMVALLGQQFTHLWFMGMNKDAIPGSSRPNQFLPIPTQKKYGIAQATPQLTFEQCEKRIHRLINSADTIVMSYAKSDMESDYEPSMMLEYYGNKDLQEVSITNYITYKNKIASQVDELEEFTDSNAGKIPVADLVAVGTRLFRSQSQCPFKAFAQYRLRAEFPKAPSIGIGHLEHGLLVHRLLENLFSQYPREEVLSRLENNNLREELLSLSETHLRNLCTKHLLVVSDETFDNEVVRSADTVLHWLEKAEKNILHCEIYGTEVSLKSEINGLPIKIHIDRIDLYSDPVTADTEFVVVDYKTGHCNVNNLKGNRPLEPQLIVYGHAVEKEICGPVSQVAFASLKKRDEKLKPIAFAEFELQNDPQELCTRLANDFIEGDARVAPIATACQHCDLPSLCRI